jgi:hypothetical protein
MDSEGMTVQSAQIARSTMDSEVMTVQSAQIARSHTRSRSARHTGYPDQQGASGMIGKAESIRWDFFQYISFLHKLERYRQACNILYHINSQLIANHLGSVLALVSTPYFRQNSE